MVNHLKGWLPVDAVVEGGRPGLRWMEMPDVSLSEPFFQQTVDRVKAENGNRGEVFTEFDALLQLEKEFDSIPPTGFIFHSSRCGSTVVANACGALENSIVLSEANVIDKLIARFITDVDGKEPSQEKGTSLEKGTSQEDGRAEKGTSQEEGLAPARVKESLYSVFLRAAVHALGQRRTGTEQHLFIKFACSSFDQIDRITRIWPRVPWIFLYRDPVETIVSNVKDVPPWLVDQDRRVLASITNTSASEVAEMQLEELCARTIGSLYSKATRLANGAALLLNYTQLSVPVISRVLNFFNVSPSNVEMEKIERGSRIYSKEASRTRDFVSDAEAKQKLASDLIREMADRWAMQPYRLLEEKRIMQSGEQS